MSCRNFRARWVGQLEICIQGDAVRGGVFLSRGVSHRSAAQALDGAGGSLGEGEAGPRCGGERSTYGGGCAPCVRSGGSTSGEGAPEFLRATDIPATA